MKSHHSLLLCIGYAAYLIFGAVMFMFLEYEATELVEVREPPEWTKLKGLALSEGPPSDRDMVLSLTRWLPRACGAVPNRTLAALAAIGSQLSAVREVEAACPHLHQENVTEVLSYPWSFIDSLYFSMTVTTTIGYGHLSPKQAGGRIVCILYSLVGIPLTGILLAWTSESFGELMYKLFKSKVDKEQQHSRLVIAMATTFYIVMGFVVFIIIPGIVFMVLEEWTYLEGIYYAYITLTTIGFGDFVTGSTYEGGSLYAYQICVILWIMVGLGYWVMVASFITKALKSKHLHSSVIRSAEEVKKMMQQMNGKQTDPTFLSQHSKATINLMLQLSNILALQEGAENGLGMGQGDYTPSSTNGSPSSPSTTTTADPSSPSSPPVSTLGIPGIAALFGPGFARTTPFSSLMGPMKKEYVTCYTPPDTPGRKSHKRNQKPTDESSVPTREEKQELHISESDYEDDSSPLQLSPAGSMTSSPSESTASPLSSIEIPLTPKSKPRTDRSASQTSLTYAEETRL